MKNLPLKLKFAFAILLIFTLMGNTANAQNSANIANVEIDGCCATFTLQFNNSGGTWQFHPDCHAAIPPLGCDNPALLMEGDVEGTEVIVEHCYDENGTYRATFNQSSPVGSNGNTVSVEITDCNTTAFCWTNEVTSPEGCELGTYTVCCDGSLIMTATPQVTYVKIFNSPGCVGGCILCGFWSGPACNSSNNTWTFPPGTVNGSNNVFIEFQSNSPWHEFDCDWNSGAINVSNEFAENCNEEGGPRFQDSSESISQLKVKISPNPASDYINIRTNSNGLQKVNVFSLSGNILISQQGQGKFTQLDVSSLSSGFYFVNVLDLESGIIHSEKIVIMN